MLASLALFTCLCRGVFTCLCRGMLHVSGLTCVAREARLACDRLTQIAISLADVWHFVQPFLCAAHPGSVGSAVCSWLSGPLWLGAVGSALRLNAASSAHRYTPYLPEVVVTFRIEHGRICKLSKLFTKLFGSAFRTQPWSQDHARIFPQGPAHSFARHVAEADASIERAVAGHKLAWLRPGHGSGSSSGSASESGIVAGLDVSVCRAGQGVRST